MDIQVIDVGHVANDGTSDDLREAKKKIDANVSILKGAVQDAQDTAAAALAAVGEIVVSGLSRRAAAEAIADDTCVLDRPGERMPHRRSPQPGSSGLGPRSGPQGRAQGGIAVAQAAGPIPDVPGTFSGGDALHIGGGTTARRGSLVHFAPPARPDIDVWRRQAGTVATSNLINVALGLPHRMPTLGTAPIERPATAAVTISDLGPGFVEATAGAVLAILLLVLDVLPALPPDPADHPAGGGLFRNGDANGWTLTRIRPKV